VYIIHHLGIKSIARALTSLAANSIFGAFTYLKILFMFSHLTDLELTIYGFVIAIFTIAPLPLFPDRHPQPKPLFHTSQSIQPDRATITWVKMG
jgi:hypothetical protein